MHILNNNCQPAYFVPPRALCQLASRAYNNIAVSFQKNRYTFIIMHSICIGVVIIVMIKRVRKSIFIIILSFIFVVLSYFGPSVGFLLFINV